MCPPGEGTEVIETGNCMLTISAKQMKNLDKMIFYQKLQHFILSRTGSEKLRALAADSARLHALWNGHWPRAAALSEHDCAMFLALLAVCYCEAVPATSTGALLDDLAGQEVKIKQFMATRRYFRFSDFDFVRGSDD